jgi:bifunctional non-homologous end joining protein LigD
MGKPRVIGLDIGAYRSKRDFVVTTEPRPAPAPSSASALFVVQKHAAHRAGLHWDFRLEHDGVLWSWAVPKGPSLDPADRRMAIHVEDHPIDYADFEGEIPAGEYGGGTVETWDRGTWEPLSDPDEGMRKGDLKFVLKGQRLNGRFTLARLHQRGKQEAWFLIKGHDEEAKIGAGVPVLEQTPMRRLKTTSKKSDRPPAPGAVRGSGRPVREPPVSHTVSARIVVAKAPRKPGTVVGDVELSHPDKELWPGLTKLNLAEYWQAVATYALPGLAGRPLSIVRCPDGIGGEHFFQKNGHGHLPLQIREGSVSGSPYLAIDDVNGLIALTQMSAIELHPWGASEADPLHPDWLVFDLDPGETVAFDDVIKAAHDVRGRLSKLGLTSFCRTTGGKGLHLVVPLAPAADWDIAKRFCRAFAELTSQEEPKRFLAHLKIADRHGRILIDWLRNGLGATAVSSYCPRARPGATVATPLTWDEVKAGLNPAGFTVTTIPARLKRMKKDPWQGFGDLTQRLPDAEAPRRRPAPIAKAEAPRKSTIVYAPRLKRRV